MSSARDYVESLVKDENVEDFLSKQQPQYDASKTPTDLPSQSATSESNANEAKEDPSLKFANRHRSTINPMPENESTTQQAEKPKVVWAVRDFLDQKKEIHQTAQDLCADLHVELMSCFKNGSWWDKARMCEEQKQRFWKCYNSQKAFLKAKNYKGPVSTPEEDEKILQEALMTRREDTEA